MKDERGERPEGWGGTGSEMEGAEFVTGREITSLISVITLSTSTPARLMTRFVVFCRAPVSVGLHRFH